MCGLHFQNKVRYFHQGRAAYIPTRACGCVEDRSPSYVYSYLPRPFRAHEGFSTLTRLIFVLICSTVVLDQSCTEDQIQNLTPLAFTAPLSTHSRVLKLPPPVQEREELNQFYNERNAADHYNNPEGVSCAICCCERRGAIELRKQTER